MDDPSSRRLRGGPRLAFEVLLGIAAAAPSLVGAALGARLALDDWGFAAASHFQSFSAGFGAQARARPISGVWDWAQFKVLDSHAVPHLVILAALNAAAAVLFWRLLERWVPQRVAVLTALVWVALPNRGSTRLWATTSPNVGGLVLLLAALLVASSRPLTKGRFATALALLALGTLAYEGVIAIGVVALVAMIWTQAPPRLRVRWTVLVLGVMAAVGGWVVLRSPKVGTSPPPFRNLSHLSSAHFGSAVLPGPPRLLALVVLVAIAWSVVVIVLPGFDAWIEQKLVVVGLVVIVLGSAPFAVVGFPFSGSGFFDRGNLFADLGTALVYGALLAMLLRLPWHAVGVAVAAAGLVAIASPNVTSVRDYVRAGRDGRHFLAAVDTLPVDVRTRGPVTFLPLPDRGGVAEFLADYDISAALALRYHTGVPFPRAAMAVSATGFRRAEGPVYELVGRRLVRR
jgi:hypothetical protein